MSIKRVLSLGLFAAAGMAIAAVVVFRTGEAGQSGCDYASYLLPALRLTPSPLGRTSAQAAALYHPVAMAPGAMEAEPRPLEGFGVRTSPEDSRLKQLLEYLNGELKSPKAPESVPPGPALEVPGPLPPTTETTEAAPPAAGIPDGIAGSPAVSRVPAPAPQAVGNSSGNAGDKLALTIASNDIREVLDMLSEHGKMNILASPSVQGKVSANLNGVDFESALDAILKSTGLVAHRDGEFIFVGTPQDMLAMRPSLEKIGTRVYRPSYVTAAELQTLITPLLSDPKLAADSGNKVGVVTVSSPAEAGIAANADEAGGNQYAGADVVLVQDYEGVLAQIDQVVAEVDVQPIQVAIEAMILSVKLKDTDKLGVDFGLLRNDPRLKLSLSSPVAAGDLPAYNTRSFGVAYVNGDVTLSNIVDCLEEIVDTNVIATPRLMVLNKHRAEIHIGRSQGYIASRTVTETSTQVTIGNMDTGTILRIRPFVSDDGVVRMEIHPELSSGEIKQVGGDALPDKDVTQVTTNVMIRDGSTVILGGLMQDKLTTTASQIPYLGNAPWVGFLFRSKKEEIAREEILVLITPHIVCHQVAACEGAQTAQEYERLQSVRADAMSPLGKRSLGRRYYRMAQNAYAAGDRCAALRFADLAVHYDPMSRAAIDLRATIWTGQPCLTGATGQQAAAPSGLLDEPIFTPPGKEPATNEPVLSEPVLNPPVPPPGSSSHPAWREAVQ